MDGTTPGLTARLATKEGSEMIVAYGRPAAGGSQQHTGTQLRVAGYGPDAGNLVGLIDQTDLHFIIRTRSQVTDLLRRWWYGGFTPVVPPPHPCSWRSRSAGR